jgi:hypothetical protein
VKEAANSLAATICAACVQHIPCSAQRVALDHVAQATHEGNALAIFNR